mgnify:CR=1 FL=1
MKKILLVTKENIILEDLKFFYEVEIATDYKSAMGILLQDHNIGFCFFDIMEGIEEVVLKIKENRLMIVNPVVFSNEKDSEKIVWFLKNGVYDVVEDKISAESIMKVIDNFDDRRAVQFNMKKLENKNRILEEEIYEYQVLYETTKILRLNLDFELVIDKLLNLLEGITGGTGFFILNDKYYYSKNGDWGKIHLIKRFLKANKKNSLSGFISKIPSYFPLYFENTVWRMFPIIIKNSIKGYMLLIKDITKDIKDNELEIINNILSQAGIVIENAMLIEETRDIHFDIVKSLVKAIEGKDRYTKGHSERVAMISELVAREIELPAERLRYLQMASVLHDVGKIALSEDILNKLGSLTDEEYGEIKKHPGTGYEIVSQIKNMKAVAEIIKYHHECWNGSGYPDGLSEKDIPIESRIISIADAYDAITSDRPYRKGMPHEYAIEELTKNIGIQFDPEITKIFCEISKEKLNSEES